MTGFKGCRGFKDNKPAETANSLKRWEKPEDEELLLLPSLLPPEEWPALVAPSTVSHPLPVPVFVDVALAEGCSL